jgi:hypothetical protein
MHCSSKGSSDAEKRFQPAARRVFFACIPVVFSLARISHHPGYHSDFGQASEHKAYEEDWADWVRVEIRFFVPM